MMGNECPFILLCIFRVLMHNSLVYNLNYSAKASNKCGRSLFDCWCEFYYCSHININFLRLLTSSEDRKCANT